MLSFSHVSLSPPQLQIKMPNTSSYDEEKGLELESFVPLTLSFADLNYSVPNRATPIIQGITGTLVSGELTAILGPSGAGKSTFLDVLCRRVNTTGSVSLPSHSFCTTLRHYPSIAPELTGFLWTTDSAQRIHRLESERCHLFCRARRCSLRRIDCTRDCRLRRLPQASFCPLCSQRSAAADVGFFPQLATRHA